MISLASVTSEAVEFDQRNYDSDWLKLYIKGKRSIDCFKELFSSFFTTSELSATLDAFNVLAASLLLGSPYLSTCNAKIRYCRVFKRALPCCCYWLLRSSSRISKCKQYFNASQKCYWCSSNLLCIDSRISIERQHGLLLHKRLLKLSAIFQNCPKRWKLKKCIERMCIIPPFLPRFFQ